MVINKAIIGALLSIKKAVAVSACTTVVDSNTAAQNDFAQADSSTQYFGMYPYNPSQNYSMCKVQFEMLLVNAVSYMASVWNIDGSNNLTTQVGSNSTPITGNGSDTTQTFVFGTPIAVTTSTNYAVVITRNPVANMTVENCYQNGDTLSGNTGKWLSTKALQAFSSRDPRYLFYS